MPEFILTPIEYTPGSGKLIGTVSLPLVGESHPCPKEATGIH